MPNPFNLFLESAIVCPESGIIRHTQTALPYDSWHDAGTIFCDRLIASSRYLMFF